VKRSSAESIEMKESEVEKFLMLLAHDLQNQIGAVDLNLQIIPTLLPDESFTLATILPFVSRASLASQDMIETLGDLQIFARSVSRLDENGDKEVPKLARLDLSMNVRDCALVLGSAAMSRQVKLLTAIEDGVTARGEPDIVHRAIKILANEALRASFPESTVVLSAFYREACPVVEISTSQEGVFDDSRSMLSVFLVRQLLEASQAKLVFTKSLVTSAIQIQFQKVESAGHMC
jgi:hypothetical protein